MTVNGLGVASADAAAARMSDERRRFQQFSKVTCGAAPRLPRTLGLLVNRDLSHLDDGLPAADLLVQELRELGAGVGDDLEPEVVELALDVRGVQGCRQ